MFKSKKKQEKKKVVGKPKAKLEFVKVEKELMHKTHLHGEIHSDLYDGREPKITEKPELVKIRYIGSNSLPYKYLDGTIFYPIGEVDPAVAEALLKNPQRWEKVDY